MSFPIIGITCCFDTDSGRLWLHRNYVEAVIDAGGVPIILPVLISGEMVYKILDICLSLKIKKTVKHMQNAPRYYPTHAITIASNSLLNKILKCKKAIVNSYHHQMIDKLGKYIRFSAVAADGVIEAIEHVDQKRFVLGLQYHPEAMWKTDFKSRRIFQYFVNACKRSIV